MKLVSGGADNAARLYDLSTGQATKIAQHDLTVREVRWVDGASPIVATGSWDKTVKVRIGRSSIWLVDLERDAREMMVVVIGYVVVLGEAIRFAAECITFDFRARDSMTILSSALYWDLRTQQPVAVVTLPERVYSMDVVFPLLVVGTAERNILIYNLNNPSVPYKTLQSPLKWQTRVVSCFPNGTGFAIGSIEGRVGIQYVEEKDHSGNFSFKCHRDPQGNVFSVNAISFHPVHGTFSTAGSDGTFNFWDKDSKQRLKGFQNVGGPIPCTAFNRNGTIFAYAVSYDWSKVRMILGGHGHQSALPTNANKIMLHATKEDDVKPRAAKKR
ncbi:WD40 repeat-like protein [Jimgerdemannia flammicorona]|uniref:WD40 repeat-like protein n=1 Tax=Jimgerdemannia flammicorona TaxID=994334 RepID=A0A433QRU3_9FUNG|nr:WD40 repeat-like protein [Jimgerdemannia flammicorona]